MQIKYNDKRNFQNFLTTITLPYIFKILRDFYHEPGMPGVVILQPMPRVLEHDILMRYAVLRQRGVFILPHSRRDILHFVQIIVAGASQRSW